MVQQWLRTKPLQGLDWLLTLFISRPFSEAKTVEHYATNGYRFLGVVLVGFVLPALWAFGVASVPVSQLPAWLRDTLGLIPGVKNIPTTYPLAAGILLFYGICYAAKPFRVPVGEKFADFFFWVANIGIALGEWCLERRWMSLFFVVVLAGVITGGTYYLVNFSLRRAALTADFQHWLHQLDKFSSRSPLSREESDSYRQVSAFWNEDYRKVIKLPDGGEHPAFVIHKMFDELYLKEPAEASWHKVLQTALPKILEYSKQYEPRNRNLTDSEKRAWALMNILLGRIYARLGDGCDECKELAEAKKYFDRIIEQYKSPGAEAYQASAHNGLGTVYANALTALLLHPNTPLPKEINCRKAAECASMALDEYAKVGGDSCSFERRRRENNTVDILIRIGLNPGRLNFTDIDLAKFCNNEYVRDGKALAECIESRLSGMVGCSDRDPIPPIFITAAQAYGMSVELRRNADANADVMRQVTAAGSYLRLAYVLNKDAHANMKKWNLCYFRFALRDEKLKSDFLRAATSGLDHLPSPGEKYLMDVIQGDADRCQ